MTLAVPGAKIAPEDAHRDGSSTFRYVGNHCGSLYRRAEPKKAQPTWGELGPCPGSFVVQSASIRHHMLRGTLRYTRAVS